MAAIAERMGQVGLRLHPDKTRLVSAKTASAGAATSTRASPSWATLPGPQGARARSGRSFTLLRSPDEPEALKAKGAELRAMRLHAHYRSLGDSPRGLTPSCGAG